MTILNRLRIRSRLMLATIVPVLLTAVVMSWMTVSQLKTNGDHEVERLREQIMEARQEGLKNVVEAARSAVLLAKSDPSLSESEAKTQARDSIRAIKFGNSNYVFAYSRDMVNLAYRPDPSKEGADFLRDNPKVQKLILALFEAAENAVSMATIGPIPRRAILSPRCPILLLFPAGTGCWVPASMSRTLTRKLPMLVKKSMPKWSVP